MYEKRLKPVSTIYVCFHDSVEEKRTINHATALDICKETFAKHR